VLLSFAQFEREVTSERIRDKIAASKRKGLWVGGNLPLGYKMMDGKIAIVEEEAELVRSIFQRYLELGSVNELYGTSTNATSEPEPSSSPRVRRAVGSRSAAARCTTC
jgi:DNA invertase Pin-like site-specific DNA recombinase